MVEASRLRRDQSRFELEGGHRTLFPSQPANAPRITRQQTKPIKWSSRALPPPIAHGADNRAKVTTLGGEDVLGPRRAHGIKAPLHDAILLKCLEALRQGIGGNAVERVLQILKAPCAVQDQVAQDEACPTRSNDA